MNTFDLIKLPSFPDSNKLLENELEGLFWDSQEINDLNKTLVLTVKKLRLINSKINKYEREKTKAQLEFKHKKRRAIIEAEGSSQKEKSIVAEIECEEEEMKIAYLEEVISELTRESQSIRLELDTLKTLGMNLRQEMRL